MSKMLHIQEPILLERGFKKSFYFDRNAPWDTFDTRMIELFKKKITDEISVEITYGYDIDANAVYTLTGTSVELIIGDECSAVQVNSADALFSLMAIIGGK